MLKLLRYFAARGPEDLRLHVIGSITIEEDLNIKSLKYVIDRLINSSDKNGQRIFNRFREYSKQYMGYTNWRQDENFNLDNHIRGLSLEEEEINNRQKMLTQIFEPKNSIEDWPEKQSRWEILLVKNSKTENSSNTILGFCFHCSLITGNIIKQFLAKSCEDGDTLSEHKSQGLIFYLKLPTSIFYDFCIPLNKLSSIYFYAPFDPNAQKQKQNKYTMSFAKSVSMHGVRAVGARFGVEFDVVLNSAAGGTFNEIMKTSTIPIGQNIPCSIITQTRSFSLFPKVHFPVKKIQLPIENVSIEERLHMTKLNIGYVLKENILCQPQEMLTSRILRCASEWCVAKGKQMHPFAFPPCNNLDTLSPGISTEFASVKTEFQNYGIAVIFIQVAENVKTLLLINEDFAPPTISLNAGKIFSKQINDLIHKACF
ncbi:unnamed protein product [Allacma fusca]|uniref:O-acyltransferase WSD1 C-terminal domain-containing protein n=1 Tax=Allacma fusca TaxID=39272 RepID=A0A8J2PHD6_9HEXA|nr:unnamed protein product [Allacma fusca]